jgi:hypothetical protein
MHPIALIVFLNVAVPVIVLPLAAAEQAACACSGITDPRARADCFSRCPSPVLSPPSGGTVQMPQRAGTTSVSISPEQRALIREYVVKEKLRPHQLQSRVTVGATLPADVELSPIPETWGPSFRSYRYIYTGDDVVLVDPTSRRVVRVIE